MAFFLPPTTKDRRSARRDTEAGPKSETADRLEADEKHGDQEDQGSEAARSASVGYVSTGPPKLTRVAGQRASEFAPMVVGDPLRE